jgi:hypothetical protein
MRGKCGLSGWIDFFRDYDGLSAENPYGSRSLETKIVLASAISQDACCAMSAGRHITAHKQDLK